MTGKEDDPGVGPSRADANIVGRRALAEDVLLFILTPPGGTSGRSARVCAGTPQTADGKQKRISW